MRPTPAGTSSKAPGESTPCGTHAVPNLLGNLRQVLILAQEERHIVLTAVRHPATCGILVLALSGYVSLASIVAALLLPPAVYLLEPARRPLVWLFSVVALLIVFFHRPNIKRLLAGTEHRFGRRAAAAGRS